MRYTTLVEIVFYAILIALIPYMVPFDVPDYSKLLIYFVAAYVLINFVLIPYMGKNKLPGQSLYNPLGFIELHVGNTHNCNPIKFYRLCAKTILIGKQMKKDIVFSTWLISEDRVKEIFGVAAVFMKISYVEYYLLKYARWRYSKICKSKPLKNPFIKVVIRTDLLTIDQINKIERLSRTV